jgi:hypothetical protein
MPAEHGSWGILFVPFLAASVLAGAWSWAQPLALTCILLLFLLRGSVEAQGGWTIQNLLLPAHRLLIGAAALSGAALLLGFGRWQMLGLGAVCGAVYLLQLRVASSHRQARPADKRSLSAEILGVALLTATAPAAWIAARGALDTRGVEVWLANLLFFLGGVLYVKYRVRGILVHRSFETWSERLAFTWPVLTYHALLLAFLGACAIGQSLPAAVLIAFVPAFLRVIALLFQLGRSFPIRRLGWTEVGHSVIFAVILVLGYGGWR